MTPHEPRDHALRVCSHGVVIGLGHGNVSSTEVAVALVPGHEASLNDRTNAANEESHTQRAVLTVLGILKVTTAPGVSSPHHHTTTLSP